MPSDYVPKDDAGKLLKFTDHAAWLAANGAGISGDVYLIYNSYFRHGSN